MKNIIKNQSINPNLDGRSDQVSSSIAENKCGLRVAIVSYHLAVNGLDRPSCVAQALRQMPFILSVTVVASNYDHIRKSLLVSGDAIRLPVGVYTKNISVRRIVSYYDFALQIKKSKQVLAADLVYVCVPDYLSAVAILILKKTCGFKVIVDIVDLWPEALPLPFMINAPVKICIKWFFNPLRRLLFQYADLILFQSKHFLKHFGGELGRCRLLAMCLPDKALNNEKIDINLTDGDLRILFLGSINSITDIKSLGSLLLQLSNHRTVELSILGGGSGLKELEDMLYGSCVKLISNGITFDQNIRDKELVRCHFGFNGYKKATEVSVSYKSLDYLQGGLPILNCTKGDLTQIVDEYGCGLNYSPDRVSTLVGEILCLSNEQYRLMRKNARRAFNDNFSYSIFFNSLYKCVESLK